MHMKEQSTNSIRITKACQSKLKRYKGSETYNDYIVRMITFFEQNGQDPGDLPENRLPRLEKRVEDVIKIIKSQERDILRPLHARIMEQGGGDNNAPGVDILVSELDRLKQENKRLESLLSVPSEQGEPDNRLRELVDTLRYNCAPDKFNRTKGGDLILPANFFEVLIRSLEERYVL